MKKFTKNFFYAFRGIVYAWSGERNIKVQTLAGITAVSLGLYFNISRMEWLVLVLIIAMILCLETANTALERMVNILSPEYHKEYGKVKDIMAGAVLILAMGSVVIGLVIFLKPVLSIWGM